MKDMAEMQSSLLKEIINEFMESVKNDQIIKNETALNRFVEAFQTKELPNVEQLKSIIFDEELN
jgi:hypothetical protein